MKVTFTILFFTFLAACSSPNTLQADAQKSGSGLAGSATPTPTPTPPKKEPVFRCRIMNGEGRTFDGMNESRFEAERMARRECETNYRHCTLLSCREEEPE